MTVGGVGFISERLLMMMMSLARGLLERVDLESTQVDRVDLHGSPNHPPWVPSEWVRG